MHVLGEQQVAPSAADTGVPHVVPMRHYGRWAGGALAIAVLALLVQAFARGNIDYSVTAQYLFDPQILRGLLVTIEITVLAMAIGVPLGVLFAVMSQTANPVVRVIAQFYIWLFRGTPVLVQLLIWFNIGLVFPTFSIPGIYSTPMNNLVTPFMAAVLGLGINEGSYMAEIVRGGLLAVDRGQAEAAQALGMTKLHLMRRVVLPQALRVIIPPAGNEFISMLKTSALAYVISVTELLNSAFKIYQHNLKVIELLFTVTIWYLVATTVLFVVQHYLETRMGRGYGGGGQTRRFVTRWRQNMVAVRV